jgi:putative oxidoreductase
MASALFRDLALLIARIGLGVVFVANGGYELVVALGVGSLLLAVIGAGRLSIDGLLGRGSGWGKTAA